MDTVAVVLGAGRGERLGSGLPKALVQVGGRSLALWSADALGRAHGVDAVLCVLPEGFRLDAAWTAPARWLEPVAGADSRQGSLARGLAALPADVHWVLVHDAARCLVEPSDAERVLAAARETGAALPVVPATDTVKVVQDGAVTATLEREQLGLAQTPQAFRVALLREALEKALRDGFEGTDCASLVERLGAKVRACAGRPGNWKVTTAEDLERAAALLKERSR